MTHMQQDASKESTETHCNSYDTVHRIELKFDKPPKDPASGFAFGTDEKTCDIQLGRRGAVPGISGHHFNITFNEERRLILKGLSTRGIAVSYDSQAKDEVRYRFTIDPRPEKKGSRGRI